MCPSLRERMYVVNFECVLRAAVGTLVLRMGVECAPKLARDVARALRVAVVGAGVGHPRRRGSRSVSCRRRGLGLGP